MRLFEDVGLIGVVKLFYLKKFNQNRVERTSSVPSLSSVCKWIRVRVFGLEYCSSPVLYYYPLKVEMRVKSFTVTQI